MEYKSSQLVIILLSLLLKMLEFARPMQSFKRYNKEQFRSEVAGVPWSVVEYFDDLNDAVSAWNTLFVDVAQRN